MALAQGTYTIQFKVEDGWIDLGSGSIRIADLQQEGYFRSIKQRRHFVTDIEIFSLRNDMSLDYLPQAMDISLSGTFSDELNLSWFVPEEDE